MKMIKNFTRDLSGFRNVSISSVSADIKVLPCDGSVLAMELEVSGFKSDVEIYEPKITENGDEIDFALFRHTSVITLGISSPRVNKGTIRIPRGVNLKFKNTSGDLTFKDVELTDFRVETVSGDVVILGKTFSSLSVKSTSGDVRISGTESDLGRFEFSSVSGDIGVKDLRFSEGSLKTTSGDIRLSGVPATVKTLELKTVSGDATVSYSARPSVRVEVSTVSGNIKTDARTNFSGKVASVSFNVGESPKSLLKFKSVSGDARFNFGDAEAQSVEMQNEGTEDDLKIFREIMDSKRATPEEIKELMLTTGYSEEEVENFMKDFE